MHFARAASEVIPRIVDRLAFCIGLGERLLHPWSLKRDLQAFEFLTWSNLDDHALSLTIDAHNDSRSGSSGAINLNFAWGNKEGPAQPSGESVAESGERPR